MPIGGGGLLSGVAAAIKLSKPSVRVIGVEPEGAPTMKTAIAAGQPVTLPKTGSIADGLLTIRPGDVTFAHVREFVDEVRHGARRGDRRGGGVAVPPCAAGGGAERRGDHRGCHAGTG